MVDTVTAMVMGMDTGTNQTTTTVTTVSQECLGSSSGKRRNTIAKGPLKFF